jgi:hypothetical protein
MCRHGVNKAYFSFTLFYLLALNATESVRNGYAVSYLTRTVHVQFVARGSMALAQFL